MAQFIYTAVAKSGQRVEGQVEAPGENELRVMLRGQNLRPVKIQKVNSKGIGAKTGTSLMTGRIADNDILLFMRQLSILISAGIPLVQGLEIIASQVSNKAVRDLINAVREKISSGSFLWESFAQYPHVFSELVISMVKAGEASGSLDVILKRIMRYLEEASKLKKMVKGAMVYPVMVSAVGVAVVFLMLTFVIPQFEEMLQSNNQELPELTKLVIDMSHFCQSYWHFIIGATGLFVMLVRRYFQTEEGKNFFDAYILKVPLFGELTKKVAVARFCRTMQTMLASGINLLDSIEICKGAMGNRVYAAALSKIKSEVESGKTLASVVAKQPLFPSLMVQMITVGESTGNIDSMLERVADFYEEDVNNLVGNLTKMVEPIILVVLGGLVAGMLVAMYLPVFKMGG